MIQKETLFQVPSRHMCGTPGRIQLPFTEFLAGAANLPFTFQNRYRRTAPPRKIIQITPPCA